MEDKFVCIIGAQRSGSTWLYQMLDSHPAISLAKPIRPEPKFFLDPERVKLGRDKYEHQYFPDITDGQVKGEKGTSYIEHPEAASRILSFYPEAKAIAILRDPISRAVSNYHFSVKHGMETRTLQQVFLKNHPVPSLKNQPSVSPFDYLGRGDYRKHLEPWAASFSGNLRIEIFEEIRKDVLRIQDLYKWIGVQPDFTPSNYHEIVNSSDAQAGEPIDAEVIAVLKHHFAPQVHALEDWLGKKIPQWHDSL